ncbi:hypothetical protein [Actinomadura keratinilytica]|uniref:hypothetical protein n=1 Tax=Actinomadura keratinilytica TaxID=547461 RepID=UPI00361B4BEC
MERDAELLRKVRERRLRSVLSAAAGTRAYRKSAGIMRQGAEDTAGHSPWAALSEVPLLGRGRRRPDAADAAVIAHPRAAAAERAAIDRRLFDALGLPPSFTCTVVVPWREPPASGPGLYDPRVRRRRLGLREAEAELAAGGRPGDLLVGTPSVCAELAAAAARAGTEVALASSWDLPRPTRALLGIDHGGPPEAPPSCTPWRRWRRRSPSATPTARRCTSTPTPCTSRCCIRRPGARCRPAPPACWSSPTC